MTAITKMPVLIVEDRKKWQLKLCEVLEKDYDVTIAENLASARSLLRGGTPFGLIIVDPVLDESDANNRDGFELIQEINRLEKRVPVIVLTEHATTKDARKTFKDLKAYDYIEKTPPQSPDFDSQEFCTVVREAVARAKAFVLVLLPFTPSFFTIHRELKSGIESAFDLECRMAGDFFLPTPIMEDINRGISTAEFVIADLSGRNPNVFYEVGISHALRKPAILLTQTMDDVPRDLKHIRQIVYENSEVGVGNLKATLTQHIREVRSGRRSIDLFGARIRKAEQDQDLCLFLTPQDARGRRVFSNVIVPAVKQINPALQCKDAQGIFSPDSIIKEIARNIVMARIIIADLTGRDPDVFYELGLSHGLEKKVILMAKNKQEDVPFDLRERSCIEYGDSGLMEQRAAQESLVAALREYLK